MALEYFCAYHSFLKSMEPLSDSERGRLFTACLEYSMTGAEPELPGNEKYIFPIIREQIDRDVKKYEARCDKNRNNVIRRYTIEYDRIPTDTKPTKTKTKANTKANEKEKEVQEKEKSAVALLDEYSFSEPVKDVVRDWLNYKKERREAYKPTGLKACLSEIRNNISVYGEDAVIAIIRKSMSNGYRGILWDKIAERGKPHVGGTIEKSPGIPTKPSQKYGNYV